MRDDLKRLAAGSAAAALVMVVVKLSTGPSRRISGGELLVGGAVGWLFAFAVLFGIGVAWLSISRAIARRRG